MNIITFCSDLMKFGSSAYSMHLTEVPSGEFISIAVEQFAEKDIINSVGMFIIGNIDMLCDFDNFMFGQYKDGILTLTIASYDM